MRDQYGTSFARRFFGLCDSEAALVAFGQCASVRGLIAEGYDAFLGSVMSASRS
jgi:hypothetical protein